MKKLPIETALGVLIIGLLSACGSPYYANRLNLPNSEIPVSAAPPPRESGPSVEVVAALRCIQDSGALKDLRFAVAVHADGTGKTGSGYEGGTGAFLPQGTTAIWASQAVMLAGGTSQNYYELNTEKALRQFGGPQMEEALVTRQVEAQPHFVISTAFTALDFLGGTTSDFRVFGIGPNAMLRGASIDVSAEIYRPGDRVTLAFSSLNRQVLFRSEGIGVGTIVGGGSGAVVTGGANTSDQQRMQEATRDLVALSVADVLARVPGVPSQCGDMIETLSGSRIPASGL